MAVGDFARKVDYKNRVDEVVYFVHDRVAYNINYYGRTEFFDAADSDGVWQIKRVVTDGTVERTLYANFGKFNLRWDLRASYFPPPPAAAGDPGTVTYPSGLRLEGRITRVTLNTLTWTALPPAALVDRNTISIQNVSASEIRLQYDNTTVGYEGVTVASGSERFYNITDAIPIYAKAQVGTPEILIEELA